MIRFVMIAALVLVGCNKPSEESCRQALANMQRLLGTENLHDDAKMEGEVRRCKGGSTKKAVECAIKAQTFDELKACEFYKKHGKGFEPMPTPPAGGSGSGSAGAAMGGAGAMPAGSGSAAGSGGAAPAAGSGSAAGSSAGSAAGSGSAH